jgi:hypothetical protein
MLNRPSLPTQPGLANADDEAFYDLVQSAFSALFSPTPENHMNYLVAANSSFLARICCFHLLDPGQDNAKT